jgi:hypothetical protein
MLSRLSGMSNADIKNAIVNLDSEKISLETLQIMVLYIPQPEEVRNAYLEKNNLVTTRTGSKPFLVYF